MGNGGIMKSRLALSVAIVLLASSVGVAQERLSDVAGSIKLNPDAIVEKEGYVEDPKAAVKADRELFGDILASCSAIADSIGELLVEARNSVLYRDDVLPNRLKAECFDLDTELQELYLLRLTPVFYEPLETALAAIETCGVATDSVRQELARRGVAFSQAIEDTTSCRQELDRAGRQLAAAGAGPGSAVPEVVDEAAEPPTDDEIIAALCEPERANGSEAYDACVGGQYRGLADLSARTSDNEMLDPSVFSGIRELCAGIHPQDYAARDRCEIDKMTAARLELE